MKFHGVIPAVITPFVDSEGHKVDVEALEELVEFLIAKGVHGLFPCGTMGEGILMTTEQRKLVTATVVRVARGRVPVVPQVTTVNTEETGELTRHPHEAGATGASAIAPWFYPHEHAGLKSFFTAVATAVPEFPVYLYNNPGRSGAGVSLKLTQELAREHRNIVGMKDSSKDMILFQDYVDEVKPGFEVIVGTDGLVLPALVLGGTGVVTAIGNPYPEPFVALYNAFRSGDLTEARKQQQLISKLRNVFKIGPYLAAYKVGIRGRGLRFNECMRSPLAELSPTDREKFDKGLAACGLSY